MVLGYVYKHAYVRSLYIIFAHHWPLSCKPGFFLWAYGHHSGCILFRIISEFLHHGHSLPVVVIFNCCVGLVYSLSSTTLPHPAVVLNRSRTADGPFKKHCAFSDAYQ